MSGQSFSDVFTESCLTYKEKPAITFLRDGRVETEISYFELNQDTNRMANIFLAQGIKKGDRVILFIPKSLIFVVAHLALQQIGAIAVPLNTGFKKSELQYLLGDAEAEFNIVGARKGNPYQGHRFQPQQFGHRHPKAISRSGHFACCIR